MVLEVLAHSRQVVDGLDTDFGELSGRADARTQKQLRRRQRTGGEDDLIGRQRADATVEVDLESGDRRTLDEESTGVGGGEDRETLVAEAGLEGGPPGVQSLPVADLALDPAATGAAAPLGAGAG